MRITTDTSDRAVMRELGSRLARQRLNRNLTQAALAAEAGVSMPTVQRLEQGKSCQASSLIRVLRTLRLLDNLDLLVPEPAPSPIQQLRMGGKVRQRASSPATPATPALPVTGGEVRQPPVPWLWGDER